MPELEEDLNTNAYIPRPRAQDIQEHPDLIAPERSTSETFGHAYNLAKFDTLFEAFSRVRYHRLLQQNEMDEALTPEQINQEFPELEGEFTRPMNRAVVEDVLRSNRERRELQRKISQGPDTFASKSAQFGANLLAHATDPAELLGGVILGAGVGVAGGAVGLTRLGFGAARPTIMQSFLRNTAEAGIANVLAEPIIAAGAAGDLQDYSVADMMTSVIAGTIAGGVIGTGISRGADIFHAATGPGMRSWIMNNAALNVASDRFPMVNSMRRVLLKTLTEANPEGLSLRGLPSYERVNIMSPEGKAPSGLRLYGATRNWADGEFTVGARHNLGDDFGDGTITVTDNPYLANNYAAQVFEERQGGVFQMRSREDLRLVDLDSRLGDSPEGVILREELEKFFGKEMSEAPNLTFREVFDTLRAADTDLNAINARLKEAGLDGYIHNNSRIAGEATPESNVLVLFGPEKLEQVGKAAPDKNLVGRISPQDEMEIRAEAEKPNTLYHTDQEIRELDDFFEKSRVARPEPDSEANIKELDAALDEDLSEIEFAVQNNMLSERDLNLLEQMKQIDLIEEKYIQVLEMAKTEVCGE